MRIIISPAKKMIVDTDSMDISGLPLFLNEAEALRLILRRMDAKALQALWRCNDAIAERSLQQLREMDFSRNLTPAILSYVGIQYQYMAPAVFDRDQMDYISEHLRILSGFYGLLRPFDGVAPCRLEMQARLKPCGHKDLYGYWGEKLARTLLNESNVILNLASSEYSKAVSSHLPQGVRYVSCTFGELQAGKIIQKGTLCKMARGQMVRWLAENNIVLPEDLKAFRDLGYAYRPECSTKNNLVFIKVASHLHRHRDCAKASDRSTLRT